MLQEIEERTSHLQSEFVTELNQSKNKKKIVPKIDLQKLEDNNGK